MAKFGLSQGGDTRSATFKIPSSDQLSMKRVDPALLEVCLKPKYPSSTPTHHGDHGTTRLTCIYCLVQAHIKLKLSKAERVALVRAGREDRQPYVSKAKTKQNKVNL